MPEIQHYRSVGTTWRSLRTGTVINPTPAARFPGDPGTGVILSGCTVYTGSGGVTSGIDWMDTNTSKLHVLYRGYSLTGNSWPWTGSSGINTQLTAHPLRIPFVTTKFENFTQAQILAGSMDATLDVEISRIQAVAPSPLWLGYYHEPEDNFESDAAAATFRQAARYIVNYVRPHVTNVTWVFPVWMVDYSFTAAGIVKRGEAYKWDPDWKGTLSGISGTTAIPNASDWYTGAESVIDVLGFDQYSPNIGSTTYRTFTSNFNVMKTKLAQWQRPTKPYAIGELGTKDVSEANWVTHFADFLATSLANDVIGYIYYNTDMNNFINADPSGLRKAGYDAMLTDARVLGTADL